MATEHATENPIDDEDDSVDGIDESPLEYDLMLFVEFANQAVKLVEQALTKKDLSKDLYVSSILEGLVDVVESFDHVPCVDMMEFIRDRTRVVLDLNGAPLEVRERVCAALGPRVELREIDVVARKNLDWYVAMRGREMVLKKGTKGYGLAQLPRDLSKALSLDRQNVRNALEKDIRLCVHERRWHLVGVTTTFAYDGDEEEKDSDPDEPVEQPEEPNRRRRHKKKPKSRKKGLARRLNQFPRNPTRKPPTILVESEIPEESQPLEPLHHGDSRFISFLETILPGEFSRKEIEHADAIMRRAIEPSNEYANAAKMFRQMLLSQHNTDSKFETESDTESDSSLTSSDMEMMQLSGQSGELANELNEVEDPEETKERMKIIHDHEQTIKTLEKKLKKSEKRLAKCRAKTNELQDIVTTLVSADTSTAMARLYRLVYSLTQRRGTRLAGDFEILDRLSRTKANVDKFYRAVFAHPAGRCAGSVLKECIVARKRLYARQVDGFSEGVCAIATLDQCARTIDEAEKYILDRWELWNLPNLREKAQFVRIVAYDMNCEESEKMFRKIARNEEVGIETVAWQDFHLREAAAGRLETLLAFKD